MSISSLLIATSRWCVQPASDGAPSGIGSSELFLLPFLIVGCRGEASKIEGRWKIGLPPRHPKDGRETTIFPAAFRFAVLLKSPVAKRQKSRVEEAGGLDTWGKIALVFF